MNNARQIYDLKLASLTSLSKESAYFPELLTEVIKVCESLGLVDRDRVLATLNQLWLPIALDLATKRNKLDRTFIQGILGGQGTGKTTLCLILQHILNYLGYGAATLSIDDLYLTYAERQALQQQDPRLIWRGPPGTHDINLGLQIIEQCLQRNNGTKILMPRFDKSAFNGAGDRTVPEAIDKPDILLFEGWFVGVQPIAKDCFNDCPEPIVTLSDKQFALDSNLRLQAYVPLWEKLDSLIVLSPEDYRFSKQWRKDAEHKMIAAGKSGMSDREIDLFVEYFWQALHPELFIEPLSHRLLRRPKGYRSAYKTTEPAVTVGKTADLVVKIERDRSLGKFYRAK